MDYQIAKYYVGHAIKRHTVSVDNSTDYTLIETIRWKRKPSVFQRHFERHTRDAREN